MTEASWSDLCDDSGDEDDEDYDPFKDISQPDVQEDSDSESFEALRHLLSSPKKSRRSKSVQGEAAGGKAADASSDHSPVAQAHWYTRKQGKLGDDVWLQTDSLLEKAEMALDPLSPSAQSDSFQNEMLANCTNPEYLRLLAVARGEREPEEEEDEEDADFVPEEEEDGEGAAGVHDEEPGNRISVSNAELSALIADNKSRGAAGAGVSEAPAGNSPGRRARPNETGAGKQPADEVHKQVRAQRRRRDKKKKGPASVVRVLPFSDFSGLLPFPGSTPGFSQDQCIQLQVCQLGISSCLHCVCTRPCRSQCWSVDSKIDHAFLWAGSDAGVLTAVASAVCHELLLARQRLTTKDRRHQPATRRAGGNVPALGSLKGVRPDASKGFTIPHSIPSRPRARWRVRSAGRRGTPFHVF